MSIISGFLSAGVDDDGEAFDEGDFRRAKDALEGGLVDFLEEHGREDEVTFQEMTPAQQQVTLYMLPPSLDNLFGYGMTWLNELSRVGKDGISPGSYAAEQAFNEDYWPEIKRELQQDSQAIADLEEIGRLLYDTQDWRSIFNQHFLGMWLPFG
ncbi:hypothetical protein LCGC14_2945300 [marine sediment metagenome]|uniref:DUF4375 domain-containing protein n=1 Tax=marine sediment metagenome TaxID=412755 RepID=A0A0F9A800_9ZZZZ